jgi:hypothetical protein
MILILFIKLTIRSFIHSNVYIYDSLTVVYCYNFPNLHNIGQVVLA